MSGEVRTGCAKKCSTGCGGKQRVAEAYGLSRRRQGVSPFTRLDKEPEASSTKLMTHSQVETLTFALAGCVSKV